MWIVENTNGDDSLVEKVFETYEEAKAYSEWTLGSIRFEADAYRHIDSEHILMEIMVSI